MLACLAFIWLRYQAALGLSVILPLLMATLSLQKFIAHVSFLFSVILHKIIKLFLTLATEE